MDCISEANDLWLRVAHGCFNHCNSPVAGASCADPKPATSSVAWESLAALFEVLLDLNCLGIMPHMHRDADAFGALIIRCLQEVEAVPTHACPHHSPRPCCPANPVRF